MEPLHVLVWGTAETGACAYYRGHLYDEPLRALGVEMRSVNELPQSGHLFERGGKVLDPSTLTMAQVRSGLVSGDIELYTDVDTSQLDWADVLVFRRYYNTNYACSLPVRDCQFRSRDREEAFKHPHGLAMFSPGVPKRDTVSRLVWEQAARSTDKAIVYETDDLLVKWGVRKWNGLWPDSHAEQDLMEEMARRADLVTVSTPTLARHYGVYNPNLRVIRNAVDPALYVADEPRPEGDLRRMLYYGGTVRLRDYAGYPSELDGKWEGGYCRAAVEEHKREVRRVFLGADAKTEPIMRQYFDDVLPFVHGIPEFARAIANTHPDIGLAPLLGDAADQCKSELHWIEYALAGAATIAERFRGDGPYNVIRDGVDGLLVHGRQEWRDAVRRLVRNPSLTADLAAAARERVLREYGHYDRAREWADAFRWAAEHKGIGLRKAA